jgi:sugar lactone lactonase YvrE
LIEYAQCPVDCELTEWSDWDTSSCTTGGSLKSRQRDVSQPALHGGKACPSTNDLIEYAQCLSTVAGTGTDGFKDGHGAMFDSPFGVAVDSIGNIYVADTDNHRIRRINTDGYVSTVAGTGSRGFMDGRGREAMFDWPNGVAVDSIGNIYVADVGNNCIRKIEWIWSVGFVVSTVAGSCKRYGGSRGFMDGRANEARFDRPHGVAVDSIGNIYVADKDNSRIRKIDTDGYVSTVATATNFYPTGVAVDAVGRVYVAGDTDSYIREINTNGILVVVAGTGSHGSKDGRANEAMFNYPYAVAVDSIGNIYVADTRQIRKIEKNSREVSTVVTMEFRPYGVAVDSIGNIYIAGDNNKILKIQLR